MSLISQSPRLSCDQACEIARDGYGLSVTAGQLPGERDQNFQLRAEGGPTLVLKIAHGEEDRSLLEAQNRVLARLQERQIAYCPKLIQTRSGADSFDFGADGSTYTARLLTWLPGDVLARCRWQGPALLRQLGICVGEVDRALQDFGHPALHRGDFPWDLRNAPEVIDRHCGQVDDPQMRRQIDAVRDILADGVVPRLSRLGRSAIHNDANDHNVIVQRPAVDQQQVAGLIDFGDMVHTYTVAGLAIAVAYAMLDKADPLQAAARVVEGYQGVLPLGDDELAVVFPMACGRLAVSACMAAVQQRQRPDDAYLSVSQQPIGRTLRRLLEIVQEEGLQAHALEVGNHLLEGLRALQDRYAVVGDVRGAGLFLGAELVRDRGTLEPASAEAAFVINRMAERGILLGTDGPLHNVLKIRPPMPFSTEDADHLLVTLDAVLATLPEN